MWIGIWIKSYEYKYEYNTLYINVAWTEMQQRNDREIYIYIYTHI